MIAMPLKLRDLKVDPPLVLAPMADYSHAAFRALVAHFGGCGLFFTEMLNSRIVSTQNPSKDPYLIRGSDDRPLSAQIGGRDPKRIGLAIERIEGMFDAFDVNMGCARGVVQRFRWGVWLMDEPELAREILREARKATGKPLTVKIRSGLMDHNLDRLKAFCKMLEQEGADALIFHPRSGKDGFKRPARWEEIAQVKGAIGIPVIGNGDVSGPNDALRMFEETGCDGVMIGRAALIRPWIFRDTASVLTGGEIPPPPDPLLVLENYFGLLLDLCPHQWHLEKFMGFCFWFFQNWDFALYMWGKVRKERDLEGALRRALELVREAGPMRPYPIRPFLFK